MTLKGGSNVYTVYHMLVNLFILCEGFLNLHCIAKQNRVEIRTVLAGNMD